MDFNELLEQLRNPGEDGAPEDIADQLKLAYDNDVATLTSSATTMSEELASERAAREAAETARNLAQDHNRRLLRSLPANQEQGDKSGEGVPETNDGQITIEDLFTTR